MEDEVFASRIFNIGQTTNVQGQLERDVEIEKEVVYKPEVQVSAPFLCANEHLSWLQVQFQASSLNVSRPDNASKA